MLLLLSTPTATPAPPPPIAHHLSTPPSAFAPPSSRLFHPKFSPCKLSLAFSRPLPQIRGCSCTPNHDSAPDNTTDHSTSHETSEEAPWSLDAELDKVLMDDDSQTLLKDLKAAAERVAAAKKELENLDKLERSQDFRDAQMQRLGAADSMVEGCQRDLFAAEAAVKMAEIALVKARAGSSGWEISEKWEKERIDEDVERVESGKAALISALVGTLASLPWWITKVDDTGPELIVSSGLVFMSGALFGITYRYAVRRNLGNTQLKAGCAAAFALVRGLGQIDATKLVWGVPEAVQKLLTVCTMLGENFVIFLFAAVALDYCFRQGFVSPFPARPE